MVKVEVSPWSPLTPPVLQKRLTRIRNNILGKEVRPSFPFPHEAYPHRLSLLRHWKSSLRGQLANLRLGKASQGKQNLGFKSSRGMRRAAGGSFTSKG